MLLTTFKEATTTPCPKVIVRILNIKLIIVPKIPLNIPDKAENKAYFYTLNTTLDINAQQTGVKAVPPYGLTLDMTKENFLSEQGVYKFASLNRYWYIANGRTITRLFWNEGGTTKTFTLPAEAKGEVTAMAFDEDETELYVGLYDAGSTNEYKGAIAILNPETGELLEYIVNAGEKIVDLFRKE